jgi:hypothetical protein
MKSPHFDVSPEQQKAIDRATAIKESQGCGDNKVPVSGKK